MNHEFGFIYAYFIEFLRLPPINVAMGKCPGRFWKGMLALLVICNFEGLP